MDFQIAAVFLCPARQDEVVIWLDLKVFSLILILVYGKVDGKVKHCELNTVNRHPKRPPTVSLMVM